MGRFFILKDDQVIEEPDHSIWSAWYRDHYPSVEVVACTELAHTTIRTRFLAIEMTLDTGADPLLFETTSSGGWLTDDAERVATKAEALAAHERWVARGREAEEESLPPPGAGW